jgi:hypothetical protein
VGAVAVVEDGGGQHRKTEAHANIPPLEWPKATKEFSGQKTECGC